MRNGVVVALALLQGGCAAREPPPPSAPSVHLESLKPVTTIQPQDAAASCSDIEIEVKSNNLTVTEIAKQNGWQIAQSPGTDAVYVWPVWFGSDFKTANLAAASLQARQQHLAGLVSERCAHTRSAGTRP